MSLNSHDVEHGEHTPTPGAKLRHFLNRADVRKASVWVVLYTILFVLIGLYVYPLAMPNALSEAMQISRDVIIYFTVISAPVVGLVLGLATYAITQRHKGSEPPVETPVTESNRGPIITLWAVVSSVLCLVAVIWGLFEMNNRAIEATENEGEALVVEVTGAQWVWSYRYPEFNVESDRLVLPLNRPVTFKVVSVDVNHSFWPVQLGIKVDANKLQPTLAHVTPTVIGDFEVKCAELCGLNHAYMESDGEVVYAQDFLNWIDQQGGENMGDEE